MSTSNNLSRLLDSATEDKRVIIVGAGVTGLSLSNEFHRRKVRCWVVDAQTYSQSSSGEGVLHSGAFYALSDQHLAEFVHDRRGKLLKIVEQRRAIDISESTYAFLDAKKAELWAERCNSLDILVRGGLWKKFMNEERQIFYVDEPLVNVATILSHLLEHVIPHRDSVERIVTENGRIVGVMLSRGGFLRGDSVVLAAGRNINEILQKSALPTVPSLRIIPGRSLVFRGLPDGSNGVYRLLDEGSGVSIIAKGHTVILSLHGLSGLSDNDFAEAGISKLRKLLPRFPRCRYELRQTPKAEIVPGDDRSRWAGSGSFNMEKFGGPKGLYVVVPGKFTLAPWFAGDISQKISYFLKLGATPGNIADDGIYIPSFPFNSVEENYG